MTEAAQQAHVHRRQNAGQPKSDDDSLPPMVQVSGANNELMPLASATSSANTAMRSARRIAIDGIPMALAAPKIGFRVRTYGD